ncbi:MAG: hypothetical protein K2W88_00070 [Pararheinheimera sp.]|nr:hypothetical protein [Rheinheimera sp.]
MSATDKPSLGVVLFTLLSLRVRNGELTVVEDSRLLEEKTELVAAPWRWRLGQFPSRLFTRRMPVTIVGTEPSRRVLLRDGHCVMHPALLTEMRTSFGHDAAGITVVVANG